MFNKISLILARGVVLAIACSFFGGVSRLVKQEGSMGHMIIAVLILLIVIVALTVVGFATRGSKDDGPMPVAQRWFLVAYLLVVGSLLLYFLGLLGSAEFPETAVIAAQDNATQVPATPDGPVLKRVFSEATPGGSPDLSLMLYGVNLKEGATVKLNAKERAAQPIEPGILLKVPLQPSDLAGVSSLTVEVINPNPDRKVSNAVILPVTKPGVSVRVLGRNLTVTRELQLLLLVLVAGALGSYIHAIRSLTDFIGNRTVVASWFWWYVARPFVGMSMALIFYAVLRGGFLAGTPADAKVVSPFGVIAVGALVGMFSDKAAQKLAEVFDTLFKADDTRKDKLTSAVVDEIQPASARPGTTPPPEINISGTHLTGVDKVRVNQQDRVPKNVDDKQVKLSLTAADVAQAGELTIALVDKGGIVTSAGTFYVTDLDIKPPATAPASDTLAPATHGQPYTQEFAVVGGTDPYRWELVNQVPGLVLGDANGKLQGTITVAGDFTVNIKVTDSKGTSVSKAFKLKVN
jgi:Putative Ig domain